MKILETGKSSVWEKEVVCTGKGNGGVGCGAKLLVEAGDVFTTTSCARDEVDNHKTIMCPQCKSFTDLKDVLSSVGNRGPVGKEKKVYD